MNFQEKIDAAILDAANNGENGYSLLVKQAEKMALQKVYILTAEEMQELKNAMYEHGMIGQGMSYLRRGQTEDQHTRSFCKRFHCTNE